MTSGQESGKCKSCGASIIWAITGNGRPIPIDTERVLGGNLELKPGPLKSPIARPFKPSPEVKAYRAHFVSCPNANEHRTGRGVKS